MSNESRVHGGGDGTGPDLLQAAREKCGSSLVIMPGSANALLKAALTELAAYHAWSATGFQPDGPLWAKWVAAHGETEKAVKAFVGEGA